MQGVIAEYEKAKFAERERRGKLYRARAGEVLSRKVPYGYRRVPRGPQGPAHLVVHDQEAAVVRRIFADFLGGSSVRGLALALAAEGTASPDGKPIWPLATIWRLLRNEAYVGRLFWNRTHTSYDPSIGRNHQARRPREEWVEIPVPAIISEDTFEAVQKAAHDNSIFSPRRTEPDTFLLRRLVRCGHCGVKLAAHRAYRDYGMARYYLCPHHDPVRAGGQDRRCPERRIRADELDNFVFDQVRQLLARPELLSAGEAALAAQAPVPDDELLAAQLARLERRRDGAQAERRRLADLYQAGVIEHAEMTRRAAELDARRRHLDEERDTLVARRAQLSQANNLKQRIAGFAERALAGLDSLDFSGRQQLLRLVLDDVRVQGWQVELRLRIPLDDEDTRAGDEAPEPLMRRRTGRRSRSPRRPQLAKEGVSSNDRLRSTGEGLCRLLHRQPPKGDRRREDLRPARQRKPGSPERHQTGGHRPDDVPRQHAKGPVAHLVCFLATRHHRRVGRHRRLRGSRAPGHPGLAWLPPQPASPRGRGGAGPQAAGRPAGLNQEWRVSPGSTPPWAGRPTAVLAGPEAVSRGAGPGGSGPGQGRPNARR